MLKTLLYSFLISLAIFRCEATYVTHQIHCQLGNQMFEIAQAITYAFDNDLPFSFPSMKDAINGDLNHRYVFPKLDISPIPDGVEFYHYHETEHSPHYGYTPIPKYDQAVCFHGYFQNEKYFSKYADYFQDLFKPSQEILDQIHAKYGSILKRKTVAVHVRSYFGDYVDPYIGNIREGKWDYYLNAMEMFPDDYLFVVFTDHYYWTKRNFPRVKPNVFFVPPENPHYIDFYFMSQCQHQITSAMSTFSWWAGWLNPNPDKIVIYPEYPEEPEGKFPSTWVRKSFEREKQSL